MATLAFRRDTYLDILRRQARLILLRRELQRAPQPGDGVVAPPPTGLTGREVVVEVGFLRPLSPRRLRVSCRLCEARVVITDEGGQEVISRGEGLDICQAQLFRQPVLECVPQPLDAPLGLRREGRDAGDAGRVGDPLELTHR